MYTELIVNKIKFLAKIFTSQRINLNIHKLMKFKRFNALIKIIFITFKSPFCLLTSNH